MVAVSGFGPVAANADAVSAQTKSPEPLQPDLGAAYAGSCPQLHGLFSQRLAAVNQAWLADAATETRSGRASELTCELPANLNKEVQRPGALCKKPALHNHPKQAGSNEKERTGFGNGGQIDAPGVCPRT